MNRIKELRNKKKMTQKELADVLQIADSTLSYWERGNFEPDNVSLIKLADFFNITVDYLLGREEKSESSGNESNKNVTEINEIWEGLSEMHQNELLRYARFQKQEYERNK